jgi:insecticidal toxin complex protein TccC
MSTMSLHTHTPKLQVIEPRMLLVREVGYCRSDPGTRPEERVTRRTWDVAGRAVADWDPRLGAAASRANTTVIRSLSGRTLLADSVDAGWRLSLTGANEQIQERWDGRGHSGLTECDELLRPVSITEKTMNADAAVVERLTYGSASAPSNQCGRLIRHDDPAGTRQALSFGLTGGVLRDNRRFLRDSHLSPDWPLESASRDQLLEAGEGHTTKTLFDAMAMPIRQTDAAGNRQAHRYNVDGSLKETAIELVGSSTAQTLVSDIHYNPFGQVVSEQLGNGVVTQNTYDLETGRLVSLKAQLANGIVLQHLTYQYDPVGNIIRTDDLVPSSTRNANASPVNLYDYDSLYQLIAATGREVKTGFSHGPALPDQQLLPDPNQLTNYTQTYTYDAGGNLRQMHHVGDHLFTRTMLVASDSNRSLPEGELDTPLENGFDANGNLQELVRGQTLMWNLRNQLRQVTAVQRPDGTNDDEVYVYDGGGQRCRKIRSAQTSGRTLVSEVRYLPGLEIRSEPDGELLYIASVQAGRSSVRILHWETGKPDDIDNDQLRYTLEDHLGSSTLELDHQGGLISQEGYYPFGGTAWWAASSAVQAKYKTVRYSGKERDATGLYYYGFRYYAPWLMRWISPDSVGLPESLNRYGMVANSPVSHVDNVGRTKEKINPSTDIKQSETLQAELEEKFNSNPEKKALLENAYSHEMRDKHTIVSKYQPAGHTRQNLFINKFEPDTWTFKNNNNFIKEVPALYANEIAAYQYYKVSKAVGFIGKLPSLIIRSNISNMGVKKMAREHASDTPEFTQAFLTKTQNGRSTQRILDDFGLIPMKIEHFLNEIEMLDVHVHVEPRNKSLTTDNAPKDTGQKSRMIPGLRKSSLTPASYIRTQPAVRRRHSSAAALG